MTDWEYCHLYLVEALLNVYYEGEYMDDPDEYDKGAFIMLNDDDDNGNGVPDNDPGEITVAGENDLVSLYVFTDPLPTYLQEGQLTLEIVSGASKITVWRYNPDPPYNLLHVVSSSHPSETWDIEDVLGETFVVEGMQPSGGYRDVELKLTYACGSESSVDKVRMTVLQVQSVEWEGVDPGDGTNLSNDNPGSHGGGWRIFPGKNTPTGQLHDKVKAKATINVTMPADRTSKVYFQVFDMDDPTQNGADNVVDSNDTATAYNGGDNKGASPGITPSGTEEATVSGGTNSAKLEYTVTRRNPGNNFKVVAHCIADYPGDVIIDTGAAKKGLDFKLGDSGSMVPADYKTPLLSVWRKLHTEVDSMGEPPEDQQWWGDDVAVDDVAEPDTGLLVDAFEPAYLLPVFDTGNDNGDAQFIYNLLSVFAHQLGVANRGTAESSDYWVAYIHGAYEGPSALDHDPPAEGGRDGECLDNHPEYSFVFLEVIRDACDWYEWDEGVVERRTTVHEIGHQFELPEHDPGGCIMHKNANPTLRSSSFCGTCLLTIRITESP